MSLSSIALLGTLLGTLLTTTSGGAEAEVAALVTSSAAAQAASTDARDVKRGHGGGSAHSGQRPRRHRPTTLNGSNRLH